MTDKKQLTDKQAAFVEEYCVDWNATQAAIRAGYSEDTAYSIGSENLKKPELIVAIDAKRQEHYAKIGMTAEHIAEEIASIGREKVGTEHNGEKLRYTDKLNALDKMAKISGMFTEKHDVNVTGLSITIADKDADCA